MMVLGEFYSIGRGQFKMLEYLRWYLVMTSETISLSTLLLSRSEILGHRRRCRHDKIKRERLWRCSDSKTLVSCVKDNAARALNLDNLGKYNQHEQKSKIIKKLSNSVNDVMWPFTMIEKRISEITTFYFNVLSLNSQLQN